MLSSRKIGPVRCRDFIGSRERGSGSQPIPSPRLW